MGKQVEESADRLIRHRRQRGKRRLGALDRDVGRLLVHHGNQQQLAADLLHQQVITGLEALRQFGADDGDTIAGERDGRTSD
ncbi:hypothetical protein D3C85_1683550 [compost metagenome]